MSRVFIAVLDSFGIGEADDAEKFGDKGADTLGHIAEYAANTRKKPLAMPNFAKLGLFNLYKDVHGREAAGTQTIADLKNVTYAYGQEVSTGKSTFCGHMEIAAAPVDYDLGYFPDGFDKEIIDRFVKDTGIDGVLGNKVASGTEIIKELGEEHLKTGKPIVYTSADSVFQIAAHEETFGLDRLYMLCEAARKIGDDYNIATVIARPFIGKTAADFKRTKNRHDYTIKSKYKTVLENAFDHGVTVTAVGKIGDIYAERGISEHIRASGTTEIFEKTLNAIKTAKDNSIVFTNFVNFDMDFGHRRNPEGYANELEYLDSRIPEFMSEMKDGDIFIFTADHGCDPTYKGTDHTREYIPILIAGTKTSGFAGKRSTFSDIGQTIAGYLHLPATKFGTSIL